MRRFPHEIFHPDHDQAFDTLNTIILQVCAGKKSCISSVKKSGTNFDRYLHLWDESNDQLFSTLSLLILSF